MKNKAMNFIMFMIGAAAGSAVTWQFIRKKYEQLAQEEIDSVKAVFSQRPVCDGPKDSDEAAKIAANQAKEKPNVAEYAAELRKHGYTNYSGSNAGEKQEETKAMEDKPYIITPDNFGEFDDYEKISLTYYADEILEDDNDEIVDDVDDIVGFESLNSFGEYEDDSVFVRNDRLRCDYEILLDQRKYSDVALKKPHQIEE